MDPNFPINIRPAPARAVRTRISNYINSKLCMHVYVRFFFVCVSLLGLSRLVLGIGSGRAGPARSSPSCFVPNGFRPGKPKQFLGRAVPTRSVKIVAQPGPKPRRAFVGSCRSKPGPYI
jgi:hypothetical protein